MFNWPGNLGISFLMATNHAVVTGGHANLVFTLNAGSLPVGLTLNSSTGHITGAVTGASGDYTAVIRTTNSGGYAQDTVEITVIDTAPAVLAYTQLSPTFTVGTAITPDTALVTGGHALLSFGVVSGGLPTGLSLNPSTGRITGTPGINSPGSYTPTIRVSNSGGFAETTLTIRVVSMNNGAAIRSW